MSSRAGTEVTSSSLAVVEEDMGGKATTGSGLMVSTGAVLSETTLAGDSPGEGVTEGVITGVEVPDDNPGLTVS